MSAIFSQANCKQLKGKFTAWSGDVNDKDEKKLVKDLSRLLGDVALKNEVCVEATRSTSEAHVMASPPSGNRLKQLSTK